MNTPKLRSHLHLQFILVVFVLLMTGHPPPAISEEIKSEKNTYQAEQLPKDEDAFPDDDFDLMADEEEEAAPVTIADPLYRLNLVIFHFNDKTYFWVLKPVAKVYKKILPIPVRKGINNFFLNLKTPERFVNCLLQGKIKGAGSELIRFSVNSTIGLLGFFDAANHLWGLELKDEDLGQTLGKYGIKGGIYIVIPFLGPSTLRDTIGLVGDNYLYPINYLEPYEVALAINSFEKLNMISMRVGDYEAMKDASIDSYNAFKAYYLENRKNQIAK